MVDPRPEESDRAFGTVGSTEEQGVMLAGDGGLEIASECTCKVWCC